MQVSVLLLTQRTYFRVLWLPLLLNKLGSWQDFTMYFVKHALIYARPESEQEVSVKEEEFLVLRRDGSLLAWRWHGGVMSPGECYNQTPDMFWENFLLWKHWDSLLQEIERSDVLLLYKVALSVCVSLLHLWLYWSACCVYELMMQCDGGTSTCTDIQPNWVAPLCFLRCLYYCYKSRPPHCYGHCVGSERWLLSMAWLLVFYSSSLLFYFSLSLPYSLFLFFFSLSWSLGQFIPIQFNIALLAWLECMKYNISQALEKKK